MQFELPPVDASITGRTEKNFEDAEARLHKARKNRKARKKIKPEHFNQIQQGKANSVPATSSGVSGHKQANDTFQRSAGQRELAAQMGNYRPNTNARSDGDVIRVNSQFSSPSIPSVNIGNINGVRDTDSLMGMFTNAQSNQGNLMQGLQTVGKEHQGQLQQNQQIGQAVQKFGKMEKTFGLKEQGFKAKEMMFKGLSKTFNGIATAMQTAGTALTTAATSVEAAASACAAIPYVGPAISAVLRGVAMALKGIAKMLQGIGKQMQGMAKTMDGKATASRTAGDQMKAQKLGAQAKKVANEASLKQGQARLEKIVQSRNQIQQALGQNINNQQNLAQRLEELGRRVNMQGMPGMQPGMGDRMQTGMMAMNMAGQAMQSVQSMAMMHQMGQQNQAMMAQTQQQFSNSSRPLNLGGGSNFAGGGGSQFSGGGGSRGGSSGPAFVPAPVSFRPAAPSPAPVIPTNLSAPVGPVSRGPAVPAGTNPPSVRPGQPLPAAGPTGPTGPTSERPAARGGEANREADQAREAREGKGPRSRKRKRTDEQKRADAQKKTDPQNQAERRKRAEARKQARARRAGQTQRAQGAGNAQGRGGTASDVRLNYEAQLQQLSGDIQAMREAQDPNQAGRNRGARRPDRTHPVANLGPNNPRSNPPAPRGPVPSVPTGPSVGTPQPSTPRVTTPLSTPATPSVTPTIAARGPAGGGSVGGGGISTPGGSSIRSGNTGRASAPTSGNTLEEKQRALSSLYAQIADEGVEIGRDFESAARRALRGSNFEPGKQLNIARDGGQPGVGGGGQGGPGGPGGRGPLEGPGQAAPGQGPGQVQMAGGAGPVPPMMDLADGGGFEDEPPQSQGRLA